MIVSPIRCGGGLAFQLLLQRRVASTRPRLTMQADRQEAHGTGKPPKWRVWPKNLGCTSNSWAILSSTARHNRCFEVSKHPSGKHQPLCGIDKNHLSAAAEL